MNCYRQSLTIANQNVEVFMKRMPMLYRQQSPKQIEASKRAWIKLRIKGVAATLKQLISDELVSSAAKKELDFAHWHLKTLLKGNIRIYN